MTEIIAGLLAAIVAVISSLLYAGRQKRRAEEAERENNKLLAENQGWVRHYDKMQEVARYNQKRMKQIEQDLRDGKKDFFDNDGDWDSGLRK